MEIYDEYDEKVRAAQSKLLFEYGLIVKLDEVDEEVLDFVNDDVAEEDVGADEQTFAAWCDQVFGYEEFGIKVRPPVALFYETPAGQARLSNIRHGNDFSITLREWDEGSQLLSKASELEQKKLRSKIKRLEKAADSKEDGEVVGSADSVNVPFQGGRNLINDLHVVFEESSEEWVPGLKLDLADVLSKINDESSVDPVFVLAELMRKVNQRLVDARKRQAFNSDVK